MSPRVRRKDHLVESVSFRLDRCKVRCTCGFKAKSDTGSIDDDAEAICEKFRDHRIAGNRVVAA